MSTIEESVDVEVPVRTAYNQWTQFEEFPRFMDGVESITQVDETHLRWVADIGGVRREWDAEISEQHPDERVAWHATGGAANAGAVTFQRLDDNKTRVMLQLEFDPDGIIEQVGDKLGLVRRRVHHRTGPPPRTRRMLFVTGGGDDAWRWRHRNPRRCASPASPGRSPRRRVGTGCARPRSAAPRAAPGSPAPSSRGRVVAPRWRWGCVAGRW